MQYLSIQSWNIQGRVNITGFTSFTKIKPRLEKSLADVIALQEMPDAEKLKYIFPEYNLFIPKRNESEYGGTPGYNDNIVLSKLPILAAAELAFPRGNRSIPLENGTRVDIRLNSGSLRIYNCHFGIFGVGIATRLKQLEFVLSDAARYGGPTIICGDLNVTIPKAGWNRKIISLWHQEPSQEMWIGRKFISGDERELFNETIEQYGFREVSDLYTPTWSPFKSDVWEMFQLKLDWFMVKGLEVARAELGDYLSDHRPIVVRCYVK